jgi:choline dehydrogenase-like flavoprotein
MTSSWWEPRAAGSVLAAELSASGAQVLVIESGGRTMHPPSRTQASGFTMSAVPLITTCPSRRCSIELTYSVLFFILSFTKTSGEARNAEQAGFIKNWFPREEVPWLSQLGPPSNRNVYRVFGIVAGQGILWNQGRNDNSPATGRRNPDALRLASLLRCSALARASPRCARAPKGLFKTR